MRRRVRHGIGCVVIIAVGLAAAVAEGGTGPMPTNVRAFAGTMSLDGSQADSRAVIVYDAAMNTYLASDQVGVIASGRCVQEGSVTARCAEESPLRHFSFSAGHGDDRLTFSRDIAGDLLGEGDHGNDRIRLESGALATARLFGKVGNDRLTGGEGDDALIGSRGSDRLFGTGGVDVITGGSGEDSLVGGDGDDDINASAKKRRIDRDRLIDCGRGDDVVKIDRGVDPQPIDCERVVQR